MLACVSVFSADAQDKLRASEISEQQGLPLCLSELDEASFDYAIRVARGVLSLVDLKSPQSHAICVDFAGGALTHRRRYGGGEAVVQAIKGRSKSIKTVYDATAGLGTDAFIMATAGFEVTLTERHPILFLLLENGIARGAESVNEPLIDIVRKLHLVKGDSLHILSESDAQWDVVYLDPMFPHREKSALVKHTMRVFRDLVGSDNDASALLELALPKARSRVVVKRPRLAPTIDERKPSYSLKGKANRFDIYITN